MTNRVYVEEQVFDSEADSFVLPDEGDLPQKKKRKMITRVEDNVCPRRWNVYLDGRKITIHLPCEKGYCTNPDCRRKQQNELTDKLTAVLARGEVSLSMLHFMDEGIDTRQITRYVRSEGYGVGAYTIYPTEAGKRTMVIQDEVLAEKVAEKYGLDIEMLDREALINRYPDKRLLMDEQPEEEPLCEGSIGHFLLPIMDVLDRRHKSGKLIDTLTAGKVVEDELEYYERYIYRTAINISLLSQDQVETLEAEAEVEVEPLDLTKEVSLSEVNAYENALIEVQYRIAQERGWETATRRFRFKVNLLKQFTYTSDSKDVKKEVKNLEKRREVVEMRPIGRATARDPVFA